jgi:hypothetical protein
MAPQPRDRQKVGGKTTWTRPKIREVSSGSTYGGAVNYSALHQAKPDDSLVPDFQTTDMQGWPITTGIVEGAARHLTVD